MPELKFFISIAVWLAAAAPAALAWSDGHATEVCDRAARRAAMAEGVPQDILLAVTRTETGRTMKGRLTPWPWTVNVEGKGYWFATETEAKAFVFDVFKAGARSFDIGCFQINYRWHGKAFRSIDAMFDPDLNAAYAAQFLKSLFTEQGSWGHAVGAYHSRTPGLAQAYTDRFETILANLDGVRLAQPGPPGRDPFSRAAAPLIPPGRGRTGTGRLGSLVPSSAAAAAFIAFDQE
ncbi:lytic transglycosylase domain-containing protein [Ruegeria arenilitoris]|uniref:lytic transglycosylase domain-containing protein n=1 Tax=Ruegeria arenilitoris TaxID=1173585 RepID=UPI00147BD13F|nr:lytic transglycosylase domain-containing protein [Ruegeria arenilitoris]